MIQKVVRLFTIVTMASVISLSATAQETTSSTELTTANTTNSTELTTEEQLAQLQADIASLRLEMEQSKAEQKKDEQSSSNDGFYTPKIFGAIMATFSVGTYDGLNRFNVRNSRFGVKGNVAKELSYRVQIDFHNQGSVSVLDTYLNYKHNNFGFKLGQQSIMLSEDLKRSPGDALFSTRSFTAIACTAYVSGSDGDYSLKSLGSRDIGAYADYTFGKGSAVPVNFGIGVFNGSGANNPEWDHSLNLSTRVILGDLKSGFSGGGSLYSGRNNLDQYMTIWTGEFRYVKNDIFVESTYQQRRLQNEGLQIMHAANIQGYYNIALNKSKIFEYIAPTLRWDMGHNMDYIVEDSEGVVFDYNNINANRLTTALNMHFTGGRLKARMVVGYEFIFTEKSLTDIGYNELMQDKFSISLICSF